MNIQRTRTANKCVGRGIEKPEKDVLLPRLVGVVEFPHNDAGSICKRRDGRVLNWTGVRLVCACGSAVDDEGSADPRRLVVAANNDVVDHDVVVGEGGVGIGDKKSAIWRRGDCGLDRNVGGWINADDAISPLDTGGPIAFPLASKKCASRLSPACGFS